MRRLRLRRFLVVLVGLAIAALGIEVARVRLPLATNAAHDVRGAYHVHSTFSDGRGSVDDIAEAASKLGLDFVVLTDHNVIHSEVAGLHHGVLFIVGEEASSDLGHLVALNLAQPLGGEALSDRADPIGIVRDGGGVPILAHPLNLKHPWSDWTHAHEAAGFEALSYEDLWRLALHHPFANGLLQGLVEYPFNRQLATLEILRRPDDELNRYDELRKTSDVALLCASDAHGMPSYGPILGTMVMHVGVQGPLRADQGPEVVKALAEGRSFCGVDAIAPTAGFRFEVSDEEIRVIPPVLAPSVQTITVLARDGKRAAESTTGDLWVTRPSKGDYRVEVWIPLPQALGPPRWVPWILSSSLRVP